VQKKIQPDGQLENRAGYRWIIFTILSMAYLFVYFHRLSLSVVADELIAEFHTSASIMGMLLAISPLGLIITHAGGMLIGQFYPILSFLGGIILMIPWFAWRNGIFSAETAFAVVVTVLYVAGQLPEAMQIRKLKKEGHELDLKHVMRMMKRSAATGQTGNQIMEGAKLHGNDAVKAVDDSKQTIK